VKGGQSRSYQVDVADVPYNVSGIAPVGETGGRYLPVKVEPIEPLRPFRLIDGRWGPLIIGLSPSSMSPLMADYFRAEAAKYALDLAA
jgi:hypothetical protein